MIALQILGRALQGFGILSTIFGLWCAAGGLRAVVSNRNDERTKSVRTARVAVPCIVIGVGLVLAGTWLADWAAGP